MTYKDMDDIDPSQMEEIDIGVDPFDPNFKVKVDIVDDEWDPILYQCVQNQDLQRLEYFIRFQLKLEGADAVRETLEQCINLDRGPIHMAVQTRNPDVVRLLIRYGCDVNIWDDTPGNKTAIDYAAEGSDLPMIYMLVRLGAELDELNCDYMAPILYALHSENEDVITAFRSLGVITDCWDLGPAELARLEKPLAEETILFHRYMAYFHCSLLDRLLVDILI